MKRVSEKGFTLVELLVVIAIIGILAATAIPRLIASIDKSRKGRCEGDIGAMKTALAAYYMDVASYTTDLNKLAPTYMDYIPKTPTGGSYTYTGASSVWTLQCAATATCTVTFWNNTSPSNSTGCP